MALYSGIHHSLNMSLELLLIAKIRGSKCNQKDELQLPKLIKPNLSPMVKGGGST